MPSIIYGILGLGVIARGLGFGFTVAAASITLALLVLPVVIIASREAIRAVPLEIRSGSLALGATKWQTIWSIVLPNSISGILTGVILVQSASMMPVAVFIMTAFLRSVPSELEDAARMDGALPFSIYWRVVLPLIRPAIATVALLTFVQSWNEYFLPLIFLQSPENYPITLGIAEFRSQFAVQWHLMFAGILIMLIPTIIAFVLASRQFIEGLTQGGVKE